MVPFPTKLFKNVLCSMYSYFSGKYVDNISVDPLFAIYLIKINGFKY